MKRYIYTVALILFVVCSCEPPEQTTFYLVRHAEKVVGEEAKDFGDDPPLTPAGQARALEIVGILAGEPIDAIYSTAYSRNLATVNPLAKAKGLQVQLYEWHEWKPMLDAVKDRGKGQAVVVCGHGDTLLPMIEHLGANKPQDSLSDNEYDKLFKVKWRKNEGAEIEVLVF